MAAMVYGGFEPTEGTKTMTDHHDKSIKKLQSAILEYLDYAEKNGGKVAIDRSGKNLVIIARGINGVTIHGEPAAISVSLYHDALGDQAE